MINKYNSAKEASIATGIAQSGIGRVCLKKQKTSGGYIWRFK